MIWKKGLEEAITPPQDSKAILINRKHRISVLFESSSDTPTPRAYCIIVLLYHLIIQSFKYIFTYIWINTRWKEGNNTKSSGVPT